MYLLLFLHGKQVSSLVTVLGHATAAIDWKYLLQTRCSCSSRADLQLFPQPSTLLKLCKNHTLFLTADESKRASPTRYQIILLIGNEVQSISPFSWIFNSDSSVVQRTCCFMLKYCASSETYYFFLYQSFFY